VQGAGGRGRGAWGSPIRQSNIPMNFPRFPWTKKWVVNVDLLFFYKNVKKILEKEVFEKAFC
jgi:hypothetical protein